MLSFRQAVFWILFVTVFISVLSEFLVLYSLAKCMCSGSQRPTGGSAAGRG